MPVFAVERDPKAHEKFINWIENNPEGFVIKRTSSRNMRIHVATCGHFKPWSDWAKATNLKACSLDRKKLENWAEVEGAVKLLICNDCM